MTATMTPPAMNAAAIAIKGNTIWRKNFIAVAGVSALRHNRYAARPAKAGAYGGQQLVGAGFSRPRARSAGSRKVSMFHEWLRSSSVRCLPSAFVPDRLHPQYVRDT